MANQWCSSGDILLDSGADISVMSNNIVPTECYSGEQAEARGLLPRVLKYDLANITLKLIGWKENLQVLVAPHKSLKHSVLLGRDFKGLEVSVKPPPATVLPVLTRAAAKRESEQIRSDQEATANSLELNQSALIMYLTYLIMKSLSDCKQRMRKSL